MKSVKVVMESSGRAGDGCMRRRPRRPRVVFIFVAFCLSTFAMACAFPLVPQVVTALCGGDLSRASLSLGLLSACTPLPPPHTWWAWVVVWAHTNLQRTSQRAGHSAHGTRPRSALRSRRPQGRLRALPGTPSQWAALCAVCGAVS